jgi:hypothetical protein
LLALLVYGHATGVFSSRKLERASYDSVAFRFIAGNEHPDHDTLAVFRKRFLPQIEGLFVQVLQLAREMGMLKLGTVALDGTKIEANASRHSALSYEHATKIEAQLILLLRAPDRVRGDHEGGSGGGGTKPRKPFSSAPASAMNTWSIEGSSRAFTGNSALARELQPQQGSAPGRPLWIGPVHQVSPWTQRPPTMVAWQDSSRRASGGTSSGLPDSTAISACWPGSSRPFSFSSKVR